MRALFEPTAVTRRRALRACLLLAALSVASGCGGARRQLHSVSGDEFTLFPAEGTPPPITCRGSDDERFACFEQELSSRQRWRDVAGALAYAAADGKIRAFASGDELNAKRLRVDADTRFPAASVTKMFIGAAAVSLSQEGRLDLQRPLATYLPELGEATEIGRATTHQLLTHTSGLGAQPICKSATDDLVPVVMRESKAPLWAPPGAVFNYSNLGYGFAGLVLERVAGKSFEAVVAERVLAPAGIAGARFGFQQVQVLGHGVAGAEREHRCRAMWPAGGLVLSVRELARWVQQLSSPDTSALGRALIDQLTAAHVATGGRRGESYGYGVGSFRHSGVHVYQHAGALEDFSAFAAWSPARGAGVAAFANARGPAIPAGARALSTFLNLSENWRPEPGPAHPLEAYAGDYRDERGKLGLLRVTLEDGALVIDYPEGPPKLLPPQFRFAFSPPATRAEYVVTAVGVGRRVFPAAARATP